MTGTEAVEPPRGMLDKPWVRGLIGLVLLVLFVAALARFMRQDVVSSWSVLATCPSTTSAEPTPVSTRVVADSCAIAPIDPATGRGWPVVAFVLPVGAGEITSVHADADARTMWVDYQLPAEAARATDQVVIAFVEVPPGSLPPVPFAVRGATGLIDVAAVPTG